MKGTTEDSYNQGALNMVDLNSMQLKPEHEPYMKAINLSQEWPDCRYLYDFMYSVFRYAQKKHHPWWIRNLGMKDLYTKAEDFAKYYKIRNQRTFSWDLLNKSYEELVRLTRSDNN